MIFIFIYESNCFGSSFFFTAVFILTLILQFFYTNMLKSRFGKRHKKIK